jgi:hypothetical protein
MLSCLSITVAKLAFNDHQWPLGVEAGNPIDEPALYDSYIELNTVTKCKITQENVYDEGDSRVLYRDHIVDIQAILTKDQLYGDVTEPGGDPDFYTFNEKLELISRYLSNQGLAINFSSFPSSIRKLASGLEHNRDDPYSTSTPIQTYSGYHGWMFDNFNGPKTDAVNFDALAGDGAVQLSWRVRFRTFQTDLEATSAHWVPPKISSELRLDISREGDVTINVDGTVYADSLANLYAARNWLEIVYQPTEVSGIKVYTRGQQISEDKFAMVNGFQKTVKFNVEKNGRSARFSIVYEQVKSNNAYPLGLRDIEFIQTLESSLLSSSAFSGKGFRTWKTSFKGKITVPPRLTAEYAWYIFHLLVQQQMRNCIMSFDSKVWNSDTASLVDGSKDISETNTKTANRRSYARCMPLRMKITHNHFERQLDFEIDYVIMSPIKYILAVSCIFNRVNNDYQRRLTEGYNYTPIKLSEQWFAWNKSVDNAIGFDPLSPNAQNPTAARRPHLDTAGTEILDTGHNYDASVELDNQSRQRHVLVTTVFDPNERDPKYVKKEEPVPEEQSGYSETNIPMPSLSNTSSFNNNFNGVPPISPFSILNGFRNTTMEIDPKTTWMKYDQDYEIVEVNASIPADGLADMDASYYQNTNLYDKYFPTSQPPVYPLADETQLPSNEIGVHFMGRINRPDISYEEYAQSVEMEKDPDKIPEFGGVEPNPVVSHRKTYASKPARYYLIVRGVAVRAKYKIPMPQVITIAGQPAIRVGNGRFRHKNLAPDADFPVYLAMWEQTYTVDKNISADDILANIVDTGATMLYA